MEMPGLENLLIERLDFSRAIKRIAFDILTDFIFAPHYSAVYKYAKDELCESLKKQLRSGTYNTLLPITIEVPKKSGLTRPGSILTPLDRLLYQCLVDVIAPKAEQDIDRTRVYSNLLIENDNSGRMFEPSGKAYGKLKDRITEFCNSNAYSHVIVTDIACFFERIYQHVLINLLHSADIEKGYINLLEKIISAFTQKDSHGIVQGVMPSDFLGNYYLISFDDYLKMKKIEFLRYVDDYWMFFPALDLAQKSLVDICSYVRKEGLYLNETKTRILNVQDLYHEETEIDRLFEQSREEYYGSIKESNSDYNYEPFLTDVVPEEIELQATTALYQKRNENERLIEKIDRFCLPKFAASKSIIAIDDALEGLIKRPHLSNTYSQYLLAVAESEPSVYECVERLFFDNRLNYDWQKMWILGILYHSDKVSINFVDYAYRILVDFNVNQSVRALCALIVSRYGDGSRRRLVRNHYSSEPSPYVREAILYSTKFFPSLNDRNSCIKSWSTHTEINKLIGIALKKEMQSNQEDDIIAHNTTLPLRAEESQLMMSEILLDQQEDMATKIGQTRSS